MSMDVSRLQVSLEEGERWRRTLSITVPADLVQAERDAAVRKLSSQVQLKGFRSGRVPASVVEKRYGPAIEQELLDRVIGEAYRGALSERDLRPISEAEVGKVDYEPESDLVFSVSFDVAPRIELARVGGFEVERPAVRVSDEEIDAVLARLQEQQGTWEPRESGQPQDGDLVSVRIQRLQDEAAEPRPYELTLGKGEAIPDVEEAIRTLEVGGDAEFTIAFPDDLPDEDLRGEEDDVRIHLDGRKELARPELNDEFASLVGEFDSLETLRERIAEDLAEEAGTQAENAVRSTLLEQIVAANPFEVPDAMIDQYIRSALGGEQKLTDEQVAEAREQFRTQAEQAVKRFLVIDEVARSRELGATEDEVDERVEAIAERTGTGPGEVYARLQKSGALERLEREITEEKVFDFLKGESTITEAG